MKEKIQKIKKQLADLEIQLQNPEIVSDQTQLQKYTQQYSRLKRIIECSDRLKDLDSQIAEHQAMIQQDKDPEFVKLAEIELIELQSEHHLRARELASALTPADPNDEKDLILEIRGGAGGDEAALFAAELFRMYSKYAEEKKYRVSLMSTNRIGIGGFKEVIAEISGPGAYGLLKFESGVHRVQRVPETEKSGRVHTSTVTVAVLPVAEEVEMDIKDEDLRVDVYHSSGHGGQSVNTTDSAVRITHLPTNTVVTCQDEKSQIKNRKRAMKVLRSRLLAVKQEQEAQERGDARRSQIGTGDRSEKIRTYNFPQDRITDHRIQKNWSNIQQILDGGLEPIVQDLKAASTHEPS